MKLNKPLKILIGILTAWVVLYPFLFFFVWLFFVFLFSSSEFQPESNDYIFGLGFIFGFIMIICSSLLNFGLQGFYIIHVILNKRGNDLIRAILGVGFLFLAIIAMPVYFFVYILPENPPSWALAQNSGEIVPPGA